MRNVATGIVLSLLLCIYLCFLFACFFDCLLLWRNKDVYIITVIMMVHPVHRMTVEQHQVAIILHTKPVDLGCEFLCRLLSSTPTIALHY